MQSGVYITNIELDYNKPVEIPTPNLGVYITNIELDYNKTLLKTWAHSGVYITNIELDYNCMRCYDAIVLVFISLILNQITT